MLQTLEVISVNLWQVLISLANLVVLYLILKHFLYKPIRRALEKRQQTLDEQYGKAEEARQSAEKYEADWSGRMQTAEAEADKIIAASESRAQERDRAMLKNAEKRADEIIRQAEAEANLEKKKAAQDIRQNIIDLSAMLAEHVLPEQLDQEGHEALIDSVIRELDKTGSDGYAGYKGERR